MNSNSEINPETPNTPSDQIEATDQTVPHESTVKNDAARIEKMNGKPVLYRKNAKSVLNMESDFSHKLLSTGPVLNLGDACGFGCVYCSSPRVARKFVHKTLDGKSHADVVVRRPNALELLEKQLAKLTDTQKNHHHVVFGSSLVDIAANKELMRESAQAFTMILKAVPAWGIRTLTKSTLSRELVNSIPEEYHQRILWGISIGILDDAVAKVIEAGTPSPTMRFASFHKLQDDGLRTYAMACPSLPMASEEEYREFAEQCRDLYRYDLCEDVFAEVINGRDENFSKTVEAAALGGFENLAWLLGQVGGKSKQARKIGKLMLAAPSRPMPKSLAPKSSASSNTLNARRMSNTGERRRPVARCSWVATVIRMRKHP